MKSRSITAGAITRTKRRSAWILSCLQLHPTCNRVRNMANKLALTFACVATSGAFLLGAAENSESPKESKLEGTWKWSFTMSDGGKVEPKVKLKQDGNTLTGTSSFRSGSAVSIQDGKIEGEQVSWAVIREQDGRKVTT